MERNVLMTMNVLPRRRRRITVKRASSDEDGRFGLPETVRFRDGEYTKRRRVNREGSGDESCVAEVTRRSSDEDYSDDGIVPEENRSFGPSLSSRFGVADLRGGAIDEILGFSVPRRARSGMRRLHDCRDSEMSQRRNTWPASSCSKKKLTVSETRAGLTNLKSDFDSLSSTTTQAELEVAEALFHLMQQSQPIDRHPETETHTKTNDVHDVKGDASVKVKPEEIVVKSLRESKSQMTIEKGKTQDEATGELVCGHELTNKTGSESLSCNTVNAGDIRGPIATSAYLGGNHALEVKKGPKLDIDLMVPQSLPSSPERDVIVDTKNGDENTKSGHSTLLVSSKVLDEKPGVSPKLAQLPLPTPFLPSGISNWHLSQPHGVYPVEANAKSLIMSKISPFKLPEPRKRSVLHHHIATNIQHHQKLISNNSSPAPTVPASSYASQMVTLHTALASQSMVGNVQATKRLATKTPTMISNVASSTNAQKALANSISCGPSFIYPNRQDHLSKKVLPRSPVSATCNASLPHNSTVMPSVNFSFPGGVSAVNLNHPVLPPSEAPFMSLLQKNGYPVPVSTSIPLPQFKGAPKTSSMGGSLSLTLQSKNSENGGKCSSPAISIFGSICSSHELVPQNVARPNDPAAPILNFASASRLHDSNQSLKRQQWLQLQLFQLQEHLNRVHYQRRSG